MRRFGYKADTLAFKGVRLRTRLLADFYHEPRKSHLRVESLSGLGETV
ncbi:hypothetical protein Poly59_41610 [Rubripirellula reticaptiva]|uniref:Uncharacterized protein n=1 Tax=Rubripirellula reticaptiva TaxID=2528013 RepID=A0A5C6EMG9_9BACT|nr:hypothetical protein Poly59_41610 [Rubripirellula reticaptiva]